MAFANRTSIEKVEFDVGASLYQTGDQAHHVYLLQSGLIGLSRSDRRGVERISTLLATGDIVGLNDLFCAGRRKGTAIAFCKTIALAIPFQLLVETVQSDYHSTLGLLHDFCKQVNRMETVQSLYSTSIS